jgi:ribonuclease HIII
VADPNSFTIVLSEAQAAALETLLRDGNFELRDVPHARAAGRRPDLSVTLYAKGPKVLAQGKGAADFVRFELEPKVLGEARLGYEAVHDPELFEPHFGIDESGKGDLFGPLVIAGVYTDGPIARNLLAAGVADSKSIGSDQRIRDLAGRITATPGLAAEVVAIGPERYNAMYESFGNLNRLLAWGHARVIENLAGLRPDCRRALSDQFASDPRVLARALQERGKKLELVQRTKAEADIAVAAASILARCRFIDWLDRESAACGIRLPRGGGAQATAAARQLAARDGQAGLARVAKLHFRNLADLDS